MKQLLPFETVIFDLDGTLAQSAPGVFQCVTEALQRMNKPIPDEATLRKFIGPPLCHSFIHFCGMTQEEADLILADEPTGSIDPVNKKIVLDYFTRMKEEGKTILISSHDPQMIEFADQRIDLVELCGK